MRLRLLMAIVLVAVLAALASAEPAREPLTPEETEAVRAACRATLTAFARSDRASLRTLRPAKLENRYGPPMFAEMPKFDAPKVDAHRARVDFTVKPSDPSLPKTGTITLVRLDERPEDPWAVGQVFWYEKDKLPVGVQLPKRSVTAADQAEEPKVLAAARRYAEAWRKRDYKTMDYLTYDWLARDRKPNTVVQLRSMQLGDPVASEGGEVRVNYTVELTVYRIFVRHLEGWAYAMRENGQWKVRPFNLVF